MYAAPKWSVIQKHAVNIVRTSYILQLLRIIDKSFRAGGLRLMIL